MNLPHLPPLLFAKRVIEQKEKSVSVECEFPCVPTLAMTLEAAAQASSALGMQQEGFLVSASDVKSFKKIEDIKVQIVVTKDVNISNMQMFLFEIKGFVQGRFTIYVK